MADSQKSTPNPLGSYLRGLARGLGPDLLGGPVDLARDALNLGIAGVGYAGHKSGLLKEPLPLIESGAVGDSDWWAKLTNVSDDGSGQYTAGRLTPLAAAGGKVAGEGAKRLVNALVSRPAPSRSGLPPTAKDQRGAIAWHGSPYQFSKFDGDRIGSGEGVQAFGDGHYFAENKDVAEIYHKKLSAGFPLSFEKDGKTVEDAAAFAEYFRPGRIVKGYGGMDKVLNFQPPKEPGGQWGVRVVEVNADGSEKVSARPRVHATAPEPKQLAEFMRKEGWKPQKSGGVYTVDIPDPAIAQMLDRDAPLKDQPPAVQEALRKIMQLPLDSSSRKIFSDREKTTGGAFYDFLDIDDNLKSKANAAQLLRESGVPGARYLDGFSRKVGEGTSNFVVFRGNEDLIRVLGQSKREYE
jgi:hypothetical protein